MSSKSKRHSMFREDSRHGHVTKDGGTINGNALEEDDDADDHLPDSEEIEKRFAEMLGKIELSIERISELNDTSLRHKWNMVKAHDTMHDGKKSVRFYIEHLERHLNPQLYAKHPTKKMLKGIISVELLLTSLEVDLRSSPSPVWLREFIDEPNCGHIVLLKFLNHIQQCVSGSSTPNGTPKKKMEVLSKDSYDEHLCLLCIKAVMKNKYGFQTILSAPRSLSLMARSLRLNNRKTRTTVLKLMTQACDQPDGYEKVTKAMDDYKVYCGEKCRFEGLVLSIMTRQCNPAYQQTVLQFLNAIIVHTQTSNLQVYYQQEIENAGFNADTVEETLDGLDSTSVKAELAIWREKYLDVTSVFDEFVTLRGRTVLLRDEVNLLQSKIEELEKDKTKVTEEKKDLEARVEDFKLRALELQANIEHLKKHRPENSKGNDAVTHALEDAIGDMLKTEVPPPPPPMPSSPPGTLPPAPPPPTSTVRQRINTSVKLPMLNWAPVATVNERSIFKSNTELDGLEKLLDFKDFEKRFELKSPRENDAVIKKQEAALKKLKSTLNLLSPNKSKNIIITKRRIGKSISTIQDAMNNCDIVSLPAEHAELLLKLLPTKDELSSLAKNAKEYENFGEAEQFLFQMAKVERYEAKLNAMTYIGLFDELVRGLMPRIEAVLHASLTIISSVKLKRVFELILLLGNHMNGSRRGQAEGFKLESLTKLQDTKSNDRSVTFLHYLAEIIDAKLPHIKDFCNDFDIESSTKVSLQMIAADVQSLRKGLDLTKAEKEKQPKNFIIFNFYNRALTKVQKVSEKYRKMDEAFKDACVMFGENPKTREPSEFFQIFINFINQFKKAQKENERRGKTKARSELTMNDSKVQKRVANEAASVAQKRKSVIDAEMVSGQNGWANGHT